ncbi:hypothetical protein AOPFMNJM_3414 [Methylobacterium jeotgali]|uniref:HMA domain-containing protein n=2 Tax=Pseudomonadota TaxID=1224 RepID=A0ABQ4SZY0_9HYPH|nr:hypothetical protein AwMethylo_42720 [Methylobacterium sp.]GJE08080.1 hypothetical protein AOPFMNJM_3414 [Methylobacterium jeotgali]
MAASLDHPLDDTQADLILKVDGMTCGGCAEAVGRAIRRLDPEAQVDVDLERGRVRIATGAQALSVAEALTKAGYPASAMTG